MDRRLTPATAAVAHESLRGTLDRPRYTQGEARQISQPLVDLLAAPQGARDRQLPMGAPFTVIDRDPHYAFGQAGRDGYCGWVPVTALEPELAQTHWVAAPASHLYPEPRLKTREIASLTMGARVTALGEQDGWTETTKGWLWSAHLRPLGDWMADPVAVAERFLGTPYLWGGNSRSGIDCSGLVQIAHLACGRPCPGDSDQQQALGQTVEGDLQRGDLLFWKGHVALAMDARRMIHATAAFMSVVIEETAVAIRRIETAGGGPVTARRRP
ncbi:NlpC/P60 family protein [Falsirhodobacter halotolerans]|uniref:C40 family peptidase n=1 Tax=Falsirhodobacter halotolerans TaxID=1146892 RepID=UPI001FD0A7E9|nr:NlpC/P60 family protein [Falsirhodobacter halotolerans]MCJ8140696.1 C40 family peptidase [Falsirhodobacter halotolerans]